MNSKKPTYISLFSGAGVGCYGFKMDGFDCIATNELIERRLEIQKHNNKCKFESGYINGDITTEETKNKLYNEINKWKKGNKNFDVDVIMATPPCQGMSVANHKKNNEIVRNSLVVESINIIKKIKPKFFIMENVSSFLTTICTDNDGIDKPIGEAIENNLSEDYKYSSKVINLKNYGANSSRTRTIVIGVRNDHSEFISPYELFPEYSDEKTLWEVIGHLKPLKDFHEIDEDDAYHFFRRYSEHMRPWISSLKQGESAFDNKDPLRIPHQIKDGKIVFNKNKNGDKYKRQVWNYVGSCVTTRNDQLASQNTIHPVDDRVMSIRELMLLMSIPESFEWSDVTFKELNQMSEKDKIKFYRKNEMNIRQSIGEAVPTMVINRISNKIKGYLNKKNLTYREINEIVQKRNLYDYDLLKEYIYENKDKINVSSLSKIIEYSNLKRMKNSAYYTERDTLLYLYEHLPSIRKDEINILEPSVGIGNFIPMLIDFYAETPKVNIDLIDIDDQSLKFLKLILKLIVIPENFNINFINEDFLKYTPSKNYDLVIGNPPFSKVRRREIEKKLKEYDYFNFNSSNLASYFLEKSIKHSSNVIMIMPKNFLNASEFQDSRESVKGNSMEVIIDLGESGFKGVLIETIALVINKHKRVNKTRVISIRNKYNELVNQRYITDDKFPYWIIYRNEFFDEFYNSLKLDIFTVYRDRQITNSYLNDSKGVRVLKSRNIKEDGSKIINIDGYDRYIDLSELKGLKMYEYLKRDDVFLTPNMTYKTRMIRKPKDVVVNGSIAILELKNGYSFEVNDEDYLSTEEYREFLNIARNWQTRTLNIDKNTVYFFGKRRKDYVGK